MITELKTAISQLKKARNKLEPQGSFTKGSFARNSQNDSVSSRSSRACKFCALGALDAVGLNSTGIDLKNLSYSFITLAMSESGNMVSSVVLANDATETEHLHVQMAYDFAILYAKDYLKAARKAAKNA